MAEATVALIALAIFWKAIAYFKKHNLLLIKIKDTYSNATNA